jgi:hypothetical protein
MKFLLILIISFNAFADCDFGTIEKQGDKYLYSKECHIEVGKLYNKDKLRDQEVEKLNEKISLKDLALDKADQRAELWKDTTYKLEERIQKQSTYSKYNDMFYFGAGVATVILTGWALGQVAR